MAQPLQSLVRMMSSRIWMVTAVMLTLPALARGEPITFSVTGSGGFSHAIENLHDNGFWWADVTGGVSSNTYGATGFQIAPAASAAGFNREAFGSMLLSSPIAVAEGEALSVSAKIFAGQYQSFLTNTFGFAVLLKDGALSAVLAAMRPDGQTFGDRDIFPPFPGSYIYAAPSSGVVTTQATSPGPYFMLNGQTYNDPNALTTTNTTCAGGPCLTAVTSTMRPGAGTYQLLVGAFTFSQQHHMGVAVTEVSVPEVDLATLFAVGVGVLALVRSRAVCRS